MKLFARAHISISVDNPFKEALCSFRVLCHNKSNTFSQSAYSTIVPWRAVPTLPCWEYSAYRSNARNFIYTLSYVQRSWLVPKLQNARFLLYGPCPISASCQELVTHFRYLLVLTLLALWFCLNGFHRPRLQFAGRRFAVLQGVVVGRWSLVAGRWSLPEMPTSDVFMCWQLCIFLHKKFHSS